MLPQETDGKMRKAEVVSQPFSIYNVAASVDWSDWLR